jgi:hypothetical protein
MPSIAEITTAGQGAHQLGVQVFPERLVVGEFAQLRDELLVLPQVHPRVDGVLDRLLAQVVQAGTFLGPQQF